MTRRLENSHAPNAAVGFSLLLVAVMVFVSAPQASATHCGETTLFVMRPNVTAGLAVKSKDMIRSQGLDATCTLGHDPDNPANPTPSERHSTAIMVRTGPGDWAEIGWWHDERGYLPFAETGMDFENVTGRWDGNTVSANVSSNFKVYCYQTKLCKFFLDYGANGTYETQLGPAVGAPVTFSGATPMGETGRRGPGVSAYDHHSQLDYRDSAGIWHSWTAQSLWADLINGYQWSMVAGDEYIVQGCTPPC